MTAPVEVCWDCQHPKGEHRRGWGPCRHQETRFALDQGELAAAVDHCECRRMQGRDPVQRGVDTLDAIGRTLEGLGFPLKERGDQ